MSAEAHYNPFNGYSKPPGGDRMPNLGSKLQPVNWEATTLAASQWNVVNTKDLQSAAGAEKNGATPSAHQLSNEEAEAWRKENNITVFAASCPPPMPSFDCLTVLPAFVQKKLLEQGFQTPTAIQAQSWPILFANRDIVGIAKTGSGKTLAFVVPALAHILRQEPLKYGEGPIALVLAPTRELAQQIEAETRKVLPQTMGIVCLFGGAPKGPQIGQLRSTPHIVVATPGRLIDMLQIQKVNLLRVTYLVLDEADRMLDMGFEPQVRQICSQIRPNRQTLMFSATWPKEIQSLAATFQRDFIRIHVGSTELLANPDVTQHFILTNDYGKLDELKKIMQANNGRRVLVFCKTKRTADQLEYQLKGLGYDTMAIHGDKEQSQRNYILERFRRDSRLCLVATDVAARGLDIKQLEVVVNYDFPMQIDDYVHRIGRTGRAGAKGESITFITKREDHINASVLRNLVKMIRSAKQEPPAWLTEWADLLTNTSVSRRGGGGGGGRFGRGQPVRYSHSNRPSFDPMSHGNSSGNYFGLPPQQPQYGYPPAAGGGYPASPYGYPAGQLGGYAQPTVTVGYPPQQPQYVRFSSDDDAPMKKMCPDQ